MAVIANKNDLGRGRIMECHGKNFDGEVLSRNTKVGYEAWAVEQNLSGSLNYLWPMIEDSLISLS